jgi:3-hydroxyisobutyrate dehydrogenase-like beta-hydroxyacid dehydrogenase
MATIGLLHPGAMGASVGAAATSGSDAVLWVSTGRTQQTRERADRGGLTERDSIAELVRDSDIILSVCPPHAAEDVARQVQDAGFAGLFVEGNAIAPDRTRKIAGLLSSATVIDGGIIGGPAWHAGAGTRFYLSGDQAQTVADVFDGSALQATVISPDIGAASALKMVFAAYTKGTTALLTTILGVAEKEGVRADLEKQWGEEFTTRTHSQVAGNTAKAWRFAGEMEEIAATFSAAGFSSGFHQGAADIFSRLADFKDNPAQDIESVLQKLLS